MSETPEMNPTPEEPPFPPENIPQENIPPEGEAENEIPLADGKAVFAENIIRFSDVFSPLSRPAPPSSTPSDASNARETPANAPSDNAANAPDVPDLPRDNDSPWFIPENADSDAPSFLSFFEEVQEDENGQFQKRFQSFFQPDADGDASGFETLSFADAISSPETPQNADDASEKDAEPPSEPADPSNLSEEELAQREEEEARRENLDALIRQNDADSLFVLGAQYEKENEEEISIEAKGSAELNPASILEAMIFVGNRENKPLPIAQGISLMRNVSEEEAREAVAQLNARYQRRGAPFRIAETPQGWVMNLLPEFESVRERFFNKAKEVKLSQKAIDVLALIAYRQPISFAEIQTVRPQSGSVINLLLKRGIITQEKRLGDREQVTFYRTTPRFLTLLGIDSLDDLPIVEEVDYR